MVPYVAIDSAPDRRSGGSGTLNDLGRALQAVGAHVTLVAPAGRWAYRFNWGPASSTTLPVMQWGRLHCDLDSEAHRMRRKLAPTRSRRIMTEVLDLIEHLTIAPKFDPRSARILIPGALARRTDVFPNADLVFNHAGSPETFIGWWADGDSRARLRQYRELLRRHRYVLFQAEAHAEEAIALGALDPEAALRLRPACDEIVMSEAATLPTPFAADRRAIVYVGSLQERKDQESSIRAFALLAGDASDVDLHLVGGKTNSIYGAQMVPLAQQLGLRERVVFWEHRDDHGRFLAHADVVLQNSLSEGVARSLREAAFLAKPIVATALPGTQELLGNDGAWLSPPGDLTRLAINLVEALSGTLASQRGACAQARYESLWSWDRYLASVQRIATDWAVI